MCRNIRPLFNFDPPATELEVRAAALQFIRKISGYNTPSAVNKAAFDRAVADVADTAVALLGSLQASTQPKDRAVEAAKARARARIRYARIT